MPCRLAALVILGGLCPTLVVSSMANAQPAVPRQLAPGVLTVVPPSPEPAETYTGPLHLRELPTLDFVPNFAAPTDTLHERARHVVYRRGIWNIEFAFKPLRMIEADVPMPSGKMQRKVIWYLVYRVRNIGSAVAPQPSQDEFGHTRYTVQPAGSLPSDMMADRFFPLFVMEGWTQDALSGQYDRPGYTDRVIPGVIPQIRQHEDPAVPLLNSVEISQIRLPLASSPTADNGVWGVATWENVDPRIDYVSIYLKGLTNAFRFYELADGTRRYTYKTLQLNFWRPGDTIAETDDKIRLGIPLVSDPIEQIQILESYRIPGPTISAYRYEPATNREDHLFTYDAELGPQLNVPVRNELNAGNFPEEIREQFTALGVPTPPETVLSVFSPNLQWEFKSTVDGELRSYRIRYEPAKWEFSQGTLQMKERVDYLWIYR